MFSLNNFPATEPHLAPWCKFPRAHHIWSGIQFLSSSGKSYCSGPYTIMRVLNIFLTIIHIWRENTLSGQSKKDCVLCWEVPQTIPRFDDSLELIGHFFFLTGGWSHRRPLLTMYKNSRFLEGKQVFSINHIVCTVWAQWASLIS